MFFSEEIDSPLRGHFHLVVTKQGQIIDVLDEPNLIVDSSKLVLSRLVGGSVSGNTITSFGVGTSGTTPSTGNTALTSPFIKLIDSVVYPDANKVQFNFSLGSGDANGKAIMEFGLLTGNGTLFARKVRPISLSKESDISFSGAWTLFF